MLLRLTEAKLAQLIYIRRSALLKILPWKYKMLLYFGAIVRAVATDLHRSWSNDIEYPFILTMNDGIMDT